MMPEENGGAPERRQEGKRRTLVWSAVFFLVVFVLPAAGLWHLTERFEASTEAVRDAESRKKARELVMRLRSALDRNVVITEKLGLFRRSVVSERRARPLDAASAGRHDEALRRIFPRDTQIHWFDASGRLIAVPGRPLPHGQRAWQAFLKAVSDDEKSLSGGEMTLAQGFLKKTFGGIATLNYLRRARSQATEVFIRGKLHSIAVLAFNSRRADLHDAGSGPAAPGKRRLGSCIVIAPLYKAKQDWELERAMRLLSGPEAAVGGIRQTTGEGPAAEPLSPGMLHGLWELLEKGQSVYSTEEWFVYSQVYDKDTDLMLTVAIRSPEKSRWAVAVTFASRAGLAGGVLAAGLALFLLGSGWWRPRVSLGAKFKIAAAALTLPTLLAMSLLGLEHLNRLSRNRTESLLNQIETNLATVEQKIASDLGRLESELLAMVRNLTPATVSSEAEFEGMLSPFRHFGLSRAVVVFQDGNSYEYHLAYRRSSWGILDAIGKRTMEFYGFKPPKRPNERPFPPEFEMLLPKQGVGGRAQSMFDRLNPIQFANQSTVIFQTFLRSRIDSKPLGFFSAHFDQSNLNAKMMERALGDLRSRGAWLAAIGDVPATAFYAGTNVTLRKILELVRFTSQSVQTTLDIRNRPWLVRARPLKGIDAAAVSLVRADTQDPSWAATAAILALIASGGVLASVWAVNRLRRILIEPLTALLAAVKRVEGGDYRTRMISTADDELGVLIRRLAILIQGLRHKARMTPFLRTDLVENAATHTPDPGQRRQVTVLFAGLRDFGDIESRLQPEEAMRVMSRYLGLCETAVKRHGGDIDKFIGDTAMAIFRELPDAPPAGLRASRAALDIGREMDDWMADDAGFREKRLRHGVGFASGTPVLGHIGSLRKRLDATVIGDAVNLAARLEKLAGRDANPSILTTANTIARLAPDIVPVATMIQGVRGRQESVEVVGIGRPDDA